MDDPGRVGTTSVASLAIPRGPMSGCRPQDPTSMVSRKDCPMYRFPQVAFLPWLSCWLGMVFLVSLLDCGHAAPPDPPILGTGERETLRRYARDTWKSFEAMALPGGLPADGLR